MTDLPINGRRTCKDRVPTPTCPLFQKLFLAKRSLRGCTSSSRTFANSFVLYLCFVISCTDAETCSYGEYYDFLGPAPCVPCYPGTYQDQFEHSDPYCKPCEAGTYSEDDGATMCIPCAPGNLVIFYIS